MTARRVIHIVDDEAIIRASIVSLVQAHGAFECREYANGDAFLAAIDAIDPGCVVLDLQLDGVSGAAVIGALAERQDRFRLIVVTGYSDLAMAIEAFRAGAVDFLHKPYEMRALLDAVDRGFHLLERGSEPQVLVAEARARLARLTPDEADVLALLIRGQTNKDIARALGFDPRQVQIHRARALAALDAPSILAAIRTAAVAGWPPTA
ncbi:MULTISPECIES: response regulator transcription factor [unclassified Sphingomonas]|uniref:response regulator transcription factor n=1 Tax=unclassified Sphingomonas TaxID=196159 RepID=UPI0007004F20|nr:MULTISPECIES: response regulator [unclassified Sphingomonas]KQX25544.1 response regulator receiver protein [Sphingomonas sp. Root1294]KQY66534.1 response regulator receiver protein [Sphingomonas sp. Root50]KRB90144.1 response regulator receiver protein [Sphingomonas sp. Root720]